ncbi:MULTISPECIES: lipoate--protein ligase [Bacillota]|uniref:lipoate--protein ligase n=1 Tax=Peptostreptococcus russellii TaxID=215200 RepID=A0A1H8GJJ6_9FIRM|nr:lipoate--protein ligase [Peptostreptococcus russellii]SEN44172.1 lipoate-protein ligase [Peptostreptococcus russellii]
MKVKIVILDSKNPYTNISREYSYFENLQSDEIIFLLWQNEPCVVMGRNQNIYNELDLTYIDQQKILPVRRFTGGGSVYHDLGNLNFTFISNQKNKDINTWINIILKALKKEGIEAEKKGRNDLLSNGKKVSGMAWLEDEEKFLIHGTLMVNLDLKKLSKCLTPDISKFIGKGIKSIKSRVVNLKELNPFITVSGLRSSLIEAFKEEYPYAKLSKHTEIPDEIAIYEMLKSQEWIFGKREKAQMQRILKVEGKPLSLDIYIDNGIIDNVDVYTDSLDLKKVEKIRANLIGKEYKSLNIDDIIKSIWA